MPEHHENAFKQQDPQVQTSLPADDSYVVSESALICRSLGILRVKDASLALFPTASQLR
jgi:hypothetical protein